MNKEQRKAKRESYEAMMAERKKTNEKMLADFKKLSYRNKLLFTLVVQFLEDNPIEKLEGDQNDSTGA